MARSPTYLICVGAAKAGTSWLFDHLAGHPDCHLRTVKELHYFDPPESGLSRMQSRSNTAEIARLTTRLAGMGAEQGQHLRRRIADMTDWNAVLDGGTADLARYRNYLTGGLTEAADGPRVVADVTPSYALLPVEGLRRLAEIGPDVRILYLMRDPVARLWSHMRMLAAREAKSQQDVATLARAKLERALAGDDLYCGGRGDYRGCLMRLRQAFAPNRLLAMFTEDLLSLPGLARLWVFLGIGPGRATLDQRVHEGVPVPLEYALRERARLALREQYDYVAKAFPTLPSAWSANMIGSVS